MNISSFVNQITQTITDAANGNTGNLSPSALEESIRNGLEAILSKGSGQSVTGEVPWRESASAGEAGGRSHAQNGAAYDLSDPEYGRQ